MEEQPLNEVNVKKINLVSNDIDSGITAAGGNHSYQFLMILSFIFLKVVTDSFYAPLPYFFMDPKIECYNTTMTIKDNNKFDTYQCSYTETCMHNNDVFNLKSQNKIKFHDDPNTKRTFINDFDMFCDFLKIGLLIGSASIGAICTNIICPIMTENLGRMLTIKITLVADIIIKSSLFYFTSTTMVFIILLLINITNNTIYNTTSLYINEMVSKNHRGIFACFFNSMFGLSGICFTLIYNFTNTWRYLHGFSILCAGIALIVSIIFLKESIRYLQMIGKKEDIIDTLKEIAKINNRSERFDKWYAGVVLRSNSHSEHLNTSEETKADNSPAIFKIFRYNRDIFNFIIFSIISLVIISGIVFNSVDIKSTGNSFIYPLIFFAVDFVTILSIGIIIDMPFFGRKIPAITLSLFSAILYLIKYALEVKFGSNTSYFGIDLALRVCVSLSFNVLMEYNLEIYSTDIRSVAFNINKLFSHIGDFFTPILMSLNRELATLVLGISYLVMTALIIYLKEVSGSKLRETIEDPETTEECIKEDSFGEEDTKKLLDEKDDQNLDNKKITITDAENQASSSIPSTGTES